MPEDQLLSSSPFSVAHCGFGDVQHPGHSHLFFTILAVVPLILRDIQHHHNNEC